MKSRAKNEAGVAPDASGLRLAVVVSTYHDTVTTALETSALKTLRYAGADAVTVLRVPGAFELPLVARKAAETGRFDAVVCLGCIIRGETPHFDYIASAVVHGVATASQVTGVPMSFGVLTTNTHDEALARAGAGDDNKGREAALAAVQLAHVVRDLISASSPRGS